MTNAQSKLWLTVSANCQPHLHPWTQSCSKATLGLIFHTLPFCLRVYAVFYGISIFMALIKRTKTLDFKRYVLGYLRSTAFLTTNGASFCFFNCLVRQTLGHFNRFTVAFVPAFLASLTAILMERPERRGILALYVANVATETLWNMAKARGLVRSLPNGQCLVFAVGISVLLYLHRIGWHKREGQGDVIYHVLQFLVGAQNTESNKPAVTKVESQSDVTNSQSNVILRYYAQFVQFVKHKSSKSCAHGTQSCLLHAAHGGARAFVVGAWLQFGFKLLAAKGNLSLLRDQQFRDRALQLAGWLGGFSLTYRAVACLLRHMCGFDDARFALIAGLMASISFRQYASNTVAMYLLWKMLQQVYKVGVARKMFPVIRGFDVVLYASCTAVLFHAAIMEPKTIRASYFKFLYGISGERLCKFNLEPFDAFGHHTTQNMQDVMEKLKIVIKSPLPKSPWP